MIFPPSPIRVRLHDLCVLCSVRGYKISPTMNYHFREINLALITFLFSFLLTTIIPAARLEYIERKSILTLFWTGQFLNYILTKQLRF